MISMTGYGYKELEEETFNCSVEIKSYNNRYLDYNFNLPPFLSPLEPELKQILSKQISRGRIELSIRLREFEENITVHVDEKTLSMYADSLRQCLSTAGIDEPLTLENLLKMDGVLKTVKNRDIDTIWEKIKPVFKLALSEFINSRKHEGLETKKDIESQLQILKDGSAYITEYVPQIEKRLTTDVRERFEQIVGDTAVDEQRMLSEIAVLLVKYSINEELQRLSGHIQAFEELIKGSGPYGKKLDFLCQELNREINTIGSKSMILEVNKKVVDMKDALENIREQLRNVE